MKFKTLVEVIENLKNEDRKGITFINNESQDKSLSYKKLYLNALSFLYILQDRGLKPKDEVVFQIDDNETFLTVFWACLMGRYIPVPVTVGNSDQHRLKVLNIWERLNNPYLIISQKNLKNLELFATGEKIKVSFPRILKKTILLTEFEYTDKKGEIYFPRESDIAFIQFSSGSTGNPKGVMLTHKNLSTNIKAAYKGMETPYEDEILLSWMPLTHDMGLIGFHLVPMAANWDHLLIPAKLFIKQPLLWLKKISGYNVTTTSSPNFGFKHLLRFFSSEKCGDLNLSSLRLIYNGAEPISWELCKEFSDCLARFGLKRTAMFPVYGLAEATLAVSSPKPGQEIVMVNVDRNSLNIGQKVIEKDKNSDNTVSFVEVGSPIDDCFLKIVNDKGNEVGDRMIGHIKIKGDNVTSGYYRNKEATSKVITPDGWLDTGDLGFMRNGQLVITGRVKDIIFANGQNYYAHDLERLVEHVDGIEPGKVMAAGVFNEKLKDEEILFFIVYRKKDLKEFTLMANQLKKHINLQTGLRVDHVIPVKTIPKTTSGKVQRFKLLEDYKKGKFLEVMNEMNRIFDSRIERLNSKKGTPRQGVPGRCRQQKYDRDIIVTLILKKLYEILGYIITDLDKSLFEMGIESIKVPQLQKLLEDTFKIDLPVSLALDYPTINKMADYLFQKINTREKQEEDFFSHTRKETGSQKEPIAIIGMGCRFPGGAHNPEKYWQCLVNGVDAIEDVPPERWDIDEYFDPSPESRGKMSTRYGGFLKDIHRFDASFFNITPLEAQSMDPQQRLLLEVCWEAVEHAGLNVEKLKDSRTGCFIGISSHDYTEKTMGSDEDIGTYAVSGSMASTASGRISYFFGLQGPSMSIDTSCSSSLVAIDQALLNLDNGRCDLAFVGGVNLILSPKGHIGFSRLDALSPDGHCKTFDDSADGYGRSEGCGIVLLKRLSDARRDGDNILALIEGTAVMHNGRSFALTVPNGTVQEKLIRQVLQNAGISPGDVDYVEAHGSGTKLGDPQEVNALANVFKNRPANNKLFIGSVKTNIGHTESAAGIAGIIKVILALNHEIIPPHLHFHTPNQLIPWKKIPIQVANKAYEWKKSRKTRIAGVSSFGISGTNAHVIIREAPAIEPGPLKETRAFHILSISAKTGESLRELAGNYIDYLSQTSHQIEDICYTTNISRTAFNHRFAVVGKSRQDVIEKLKKFKVEGESAEVYTAADKRDKKFNGKIAFLFTGQGSCYIGMAKELYETASVFKEQLERCDKLFSTYIDQSLTRLLYGSSTPGSEINQAIYTQPIIFAIEYSLCKLWESWGITPSLVIGHSIGEYAAACIAGVFTLEEAVRMVALRGKLLQTVPRNGMMAGMLMSEAKARGMTSPYPDSISIAAVNSPQNVTVSGLKETVEQVIRQAKECGIFVERLNISHPFHSVLMEPYVEKFRKEIGSQTFPKPGIPIISTITGNIVNDAMCDTQYWTTHIRQTVRFADAMKVARDKGIRVFLEVGGTATLCGLAAEGVTDKDAIFLPSLRKGSHPWRQLSNSLAQLYVNGFNPDWDQFNKPYAKKKTILPSYPFRRQWYWFEKTPVNESVTRIAAGAPANSEFKSIKKVNVVNIIGEEKPVENIQAGLKNMIEIISGIKPGDIQPDASLFSFGIDSLMLVKLRKKINEKYKVDITINDFFTKYTTLEKITHYLSEQTPDLGEQIPAEHKEISLPDTDGDIKNIIEKQLEIMKEQLNVLKKSSTSPAAAPRDRLKTGMDSPGGTGRVNPYLRRFKQEKDDLTAEQEAFIKRFTDRYTAKTRGSKAYTQANRQVLSDWLNSVNFRMSLKELIYPIVSQRSAGSRFWDIDGNEYIDLAMGFGANYFGHRPGFLVEALKKQIDEGYELGTQSKLAGEVARLICRLAKVERVVFSNTGTEAVMASVRIARTVTARDKIVRFAGSFHGTFDGVLAEGDENGTFPASRGTPQAMVADTIVLLYGSQDSLDKIEELGEELAAVLVEPVQSRRPGFHPRQFLQQLREITSRIGAALIFDDIYMGFRIHQGGSQAYFNIEADIVTFGKVIGGGMPIGLIAGKAKYLDAIDGGYWEYGDNSFPGMQPTFFSGTFCRHPLTMATSYTVLKYMDQQGPTLQENVNKNAQHLVNALNYLLETENIPILVRNFGSLFQFESFGHYDLVFQPVEMDLFFLLLIEKGVYVWERRVCTLSTAHTAEDSEYVINAVKNSINELRQGGFPFSTLSREEDKEKPAVLPGEEKTDNTNDCDCLLLPAQERYFVLNQIKGLEKAVHLSMAMTIKGRLDLKKMESAAQEVVKRHDIFRLGFQEKDGEIIPRMHDEVEFTIQYRKNASDKLDEAIEEFLRPYHLDTPPLIRIGVVELADDDFLLVIDSHHIVTDGDSADIIIQELLQLYQGKPLPPVKIQYKEYFSWWTNYLNSPTFKIHEQFWVEQFSGPSVQLQLPIDFPRPIKKNYQGALFDFRLDKDITNHLKQLARTSDATLFMILLTSYYLLLHKLSGQEVIIAGIPVSIRDEKDFDTIPGFFTNILALRARPRQDKPFTSFLKEIKMDLLAAYLHKEYPFERLHKNIDIKNDLSRSPLFDAMFIYENVNNRLLNIEGLECSLYYIDPKVSLYDLTLEVSEQADCLDIKFYYSTALFKRETIKKWGNYFKQVLEDILSHPHRIIGDIHGPLKARKQTAVSGREAIEPPAPPGGEDAAKKGEQMQPPPANEIETQLIRIWQKELNIKNVSVTDNFFELGGRSLDTIRTISSINSQLGTNISLAALFQYPTVSELAPLVEKALGQNIGNREKNIPAVPLRPAYDLSHEQKRYWVNAQVNASGKGVVDAPGVEISADIFTLEGTLNPDRLKKALAKVIKRYDILRTTYEEQEGKPVQIIHPYTDTGIPLEYDDLSGYPTDQRDKQLSVRLLKEYNRRFNLKTWPLIRFNIYKIDESKHIFFCNAPHINFDGWSFTILLENIAHFYNTLKPGETTSLLPPVPRYVDYVEWHEKRLSSGQLDHQAKYWTRYLTAKIPVSQIPGDDDAGMTAIEPSRIFQLKLNPRLTAKLQETAARENTTLFVTMLSILKTWIAIMANQTMITVGTAFSGRTYPELEKIPGIMMNLLPLRLDLSGNPDCSQILSRTKQVVLEAYNNQDYPLGLAAHKMRKVINLNRDIYSIMFIGQEALDSKVHFDGLKISSCPLAKIISGQNNNDDDGFYDCDYHLQQDLLIEMLAGKNQIYLLIRYNNRRFSSQAIKRYFDHFKSIVEQFLDPMNPRLSQLQSFKMCELDELF